MKRGNIYDLEKLQIDRKFVEERFKYEDGGHGHNHQAKATPEPSAIP